MILEAVLRAHDSRPVDVLIRDHVIAEIRESQSARSPRRILTGLVDLHTHLREPGTKGETMETGALAAAVGGYTDVFAMPNTDPCPDDVTTFRAISALSRGRAARVHVVAAATIGRQGNVIVDVPALIAEGAVLFSDDGACVEDPAIVQRLLGYTAELPGVFAQHAQSSSIVRDGTVDETVAAIVGAQPWPRRGEWEVIARDLEIARRTGGRLHVCHVSTREGVDLLRSAKADGVRVTAEVTPHHLELTSGDAQVRGPLLKVNPPLRSVSDTEALREGLRDGTIDVVATDHAPHPPETKRRPWSAAAFGLTGLETALAVVVDVFTGSDGQIDWSGIQRVMSTTPARIGLLDTVGRLDVGSPATLVLIDPTAKHTIDIETQASAARNSAFAGRQASIAVDLTMINGAATYLRPGAAHIL